jgi:cytochrome c553
VVFCSFKQTGITMSKWLVSISMAALLAASGSTMAAGDAAAGKAKSATCMACHMADGNSVNPEWPKLAGQHAVYLEKQILAFKKGETRNNALMAPMVASLSEQDVADLAAYFSEQTQNPGKADPALVEKGRQIYVAGIPAKEVSACSACHGPRGLGNPAADFPRISGQHATYLTNTMKDFRSGARHNDPQAMMRDVVNRMSDEDIAAVASYVQGLR